MAYTLRKARAEDKKRIEALFIEMLKSIYHTDEVRGYEPGYLDKFFSGSEDWICVAEDGDVAAFLSIEAYREPDYLYLDDLSVTEACRGRGIGTSLIRSAENYAKDGGFSRIVFHVEQANRDAHRLYVRLGYRDDAVQGSRIRMIKSI